VIDGGELTVKLVAAVEPNLTASARSSSLEIASRGDQPPLGASGGSSSSQDLGDQGFPRPPDVKEFPVHNLEMP